MTSTVNASSSRSSSTLAPSRHDESRRRAHETMRSPAAFLGAMYLGALVLTALAAREKAWANARVSFAASICLVPLLFVVTLVHLDRFHTDSDDAVTLVGTWIFITTSTLAVLASVAVARYSGTPDWSHPDAWAILAVLASMLVVGAFGLLAERSAR